MIEKVKNLLEDDENFEPVEDNPSYYVTDLGRVISCKRREPRELAAVGTEYPMVSLWDDGASDMRYVHRMVLKAFRRDPEDGEITRHLNGDPHDNRLENLCWGTHKENHRDRIRHGDDRRGEGHPLAKLTEDDVIEIRIAIDQGESTTSVADRFGTTSGHVSMISRGLRWSHVGGPIQE